MFLSLILAAQTVAPIASLDDYLKLDTGKPNWTMGPSNREFDELRLNSLTWQGDQWRHEIIISGAKIKSDTIILNLTGDRMGNTMDEFTTLFSKTCHLPVATVYGIPNQPTLGMREDELVGFAIQKFFTTKDNTWPLLLPMTKSAIQSMDAIEEWSNGRFKKFILTGTSKRGATSWLAASSGDARIVGIVPTVADAMMDMTRQLQVQKKAWGRYTPMISDFEKMDPVPFFLFPRGREMMNLSDPYFALSKVRVPVLAVDATNDAFVVTDSAKLYWDDIKVPKLFKTIPNATHFFAIPNARVAGYSRAQSIDFMNSVRYFAECISGKIPGGLPDISDTRNPRRGAAKTWSTGADTLWLTDSTWKAGTSSPSAKFAASFTDVTFRGDGYTASFSSMVNVTALTP